MTFDKSRVYTALNADELNAGDKVVVADTLADLKTCVNDGCFIKILDRVAGENCQYRFVAGYEGQSVVCRFLLAYLVERA